MALSTIYGGEFGQVLVCVLCVIGFMVILVTVGISTTLCTEYVFSLELRQSYMNGPTFKYLSRSLALSSLSLSLS